MENKRHSGVYIDVSRNLYEIDMIADEILIHYNIPIDEDYIVWFDAEGFEDVDSYEQTVQHLLKISKGKLKFDSLTIKSGFSEQRWYERKVYLVEINLSKDEKFHTLKIFCEKWFDLQFLYEFNNVISDFFKFNNRFYPIKTSDQSILIVYVDDKTYRSMVEKKLIEDEYEVYRPDNFNTTTIKEERYFNKLI